MGDTFGDTPVRLPCYLVRHRHALAFRIVVPASLRPSVGRTSFKRTLPTSSKREALAWALVLSSAYTRLFEQVARGAQVSNKTFEELYASAAQALAERGTGREYTLRIGGVEISTDGSQAEHERVLQALKHAAPLAQSAPAPAMPSVAQMTGVPAGITPKPLGAAITGYLAWKQSQLTAKEHGKAKMVLTEFSGWVGKDKAPVHTLTPNDLGNYTQTQLNKGHAKTYVNNKVSVLRGFFAWAANNGHYPKGQDPTSGHIKFSKREKVLQVARGWQMFKPEQLHAIFDPATYTSIREDESRWLPILLLYTGARSNEIARLELEDIAQKGEHWALEITVLGEDKSVKTLESIRKIPIHPDLIALGFLDKVAALRQAGHTKLFPGLNFAAQNGPANAPQRAFSRLLGRVGVKARGDGLVGVHSLRSTVISTLDEAGVALGWRQRYAGHKDDEPNTLQSVSVERYSKEAEIIAALAAHCHPPLNWSNKGVVDIEAFKRILK